MFLYLFCLCLSNTFFVLHMPRLQRLTPDVSHSLFQLNGFQLLSLIELRNVLNPVKVKSKNSNGTVYTDNTPSITNGALNYPSSLKPLLAGISINF